MQASAMLSLSSTVFYMLFDHYQCITMILTCLGAHCTKKLSIISLDIIKSALKLVTTVPVAEVGGAVMLVMALGMYVCKRILIVCLI